MADSQFVFHFIAETSDYLRKVKQIDALNAQITKNLGGQFANATKLLGKPIEKVSLNKLGEQIRTVTQAFRTPDGAIKQFAQSFNVLSGAAVANSAALKDVTGNTNKYENALVNIGKRALSVAPVWIAMRSALTSVISAFQGSVENIVKFDKALSRAKFNLLGTVSDVGSTMASVQKQITDFSVKTGISTEQITFAFEKFASAGFDVKTSLSAAFSTAKLSAVLFEDASTTAEAFAASLNVLVDRTNKLVSPGEQIQTIYAQISQLWKDNVFSINGFKEGLEKFASTSKTLNLSAQETIAILAALNTSAVSGSRAGTLLRTSFAQLIAHLNDLAPLLGVKVNPAIDSTFEILMKTLGALQQINDPAQLKEFNDAIQKIFGGVRGGETIRALLSVNEQLQKNIALNGDIGKANNEFDEIDKSLGRQVDHFHNLNKEIGKSILLAFLGGLNDAAKNLEGINNALVNVKAILDTKPSPKTLFAFLLGGPFFGGRQLGLDKLAADAKTQLAELQKNINEGLSGKLSQTELVDLIVDLKFKQESGQNPLGAGVDLTKVRANLQEQLSKLNASVAAEAQKTATSVAPATATKINEIIIANALEELKLHGATNSELTKATALWREQLGFQDTDIEKLTQRLKLEKEIKEEKKLQNNISSDSQKIFTIAQESGNEIAGKIADVLSGATDFSTFIRRGGEEVDIFKKKFPDLFAGKQQEAFFKGNIVPGLNETPGGQRIKVPENQPKPDVKAESDRALRLANEAENKVALEQQRANDRAKAIADAQKIAEENRLKGQQPLLNVGGLSRTNINQILGNQPIQGALTNSAFQQNNPFFGATRGQLQGSLQSLQEAPPKKQVEINLKINGENRLILGSKEDLIKLVNDEVTTEMLNMVDDITNRPESPVAQSIQKKALGI